MAPTDRTNYFKVVSLIVEIACNVIWKFIEEKILGSSSFESFLNSKEKKHKMIHLYDSSECCECVQNKIKGENPLSREKLLSRKQLLLLYKYDKTKNINEHNKLKYKKVMCICNYVAIANIDVKVVDITLANYIIQISGNHELGLDNWMTQIKDVRNEMFHISDIQAITDDKFSRKWEKLKGSILGIAQLINSTFTEETEKKILQTKKLTFIPEYMLKYEIMCRDYWRNKCAEFERVQIEEINTKAEALHTTFPSVFSKSSKEDCKETVKNIQHLTTVVDKINILIKLFGNLESMNISYDTEVLNTDLQRVHVPAFLQLDIPTSWNETKVFEYLDEIRINRTSDVDVKIIAISRDDLNMYTEISRALLGNVELLKSEINHIMSGMLSDAKIDSSQNAEVILNLTVPDFTVSEECYEMKHEDATVEIEHVPATDSDSLSHQQECDVAEECYEMKHEDATVEIEHVPATDSDSLSHQQECDVAEECYKMKHEDATVEIEHVPATDSDSLSQQQECEGTLPCNYELLHTLEITTVGVIFYGCVVMNDYLVLTDYHNSKILIFNKDRSYNQAIKVSSKPWFLSKIREQYIAVSYKECYIEVIQIFTGQVSKRIKTKGTPFSISYQNGLLYVVIDQKKIDIMNLKGEINDTLTLSCPELTFFSIATTTDRLLVCDYIRDTLYCFDLHGTFIWNFANDKFIFLWGVTTDGLNNVYVSCRHSNNVLELSIDGAHHNELLTSNDGLIYPTGIDYNTSNNLLLVCNEQGGMVIWCNEISGNVKRHEEIDDLAILNYKSIVPPTQIQKPQKLTSSLLYTIRVNKNLVRRLRERIKIESAPEIPGCAIIEGKYVILLDKNAQKIIIHTLDDNINQIIILSGKPHRISVIDDTFVAVSYNQNFVEVININTGNIKDRIVTGGNSLGISYQNELLYIVIDTEKIDVRNMFGAKIRSFNCPSTTVRYISTDNDRLFLADPLHDMLYCCDLYGSVLWKFKNDKMKSPNGITTDEKGYVFVACHVSNNVLVVTENGNFYQELLTTDDGLLKPNGIYYDKSNNCILVNNVENGDVFLYKVHVD